MNKSSLKIFAIEARKELMEKMRTRLEILGINKNGIEKETLSTSWISKDTEPRVDQHLKMETKLDGKGNIIEETEIRIEIINEKTREYKENGIRKKTVITYEYYE